METQGEKSRQMQIAQALGTVVEADVQANSEDKKENSKVITHFLFGQRVKI